MKCVPVIETGFELLGVFVFKHRWKVIILSCLLNGMFGLGLLSLHSNNSIENLYIHSNTETKRLTNALLKLFPDKSGGMFERHSSVSFPLFIDIIVFGRKNENMLQKEILNEINLYIEEIRNIQSTSTYFEQVSYEEVCARHGESCVTDGLEILTELGNCGNQTCSLSLEFLSKYHRKPVSDIMRTLGNVTVVNKTITDARFLKFRLYLRQDTRGRLRDSKLWLDEVKRYLAESKMKHIRLVYSHSKSFLEEMGMDVYPDIKYFALSFTVLMTYLGFFMSGGDCVSSKVNLGRIASLVVPLSILGSWGLTSGSGRDFTDILGVMPYVAIYFETNNVLVTLSILSGTTTDADAKERVRVTVRRSGIPVTIVTLSYIATFSAGIPSRYLVMAIYSVYTVSTLLFIYVNHMLFFTACLAIHECRVDENRHFCTCSTVPTATAAKKNNKSFCFLCCCTGQKPAKRSDTASKLEKITRVILPRLVLQTQVKYLGAVTFIVYICASVWQSTSFSIGVIEKTYVAEDSYVSHFNAIDKKFFSSETYLTFVLPGHLNYRDPRTSSSLSYAEKKIGQNIYVDKSSLISWFSSYSASQYHNRSSDDSFIRSLQEFLEEYPKFKDDVIFAETGEIVVTRFYFRAAHINSIKDLLSMKKSLLEAEEISDDVEDIIDSRTKMFPLDSRDISTHIRYSKGKTISDDNSEEFEEEFLEDGIILHSPSFIYIDKSSSPLKETALMVSVQILVSLTLITLACPHVLAFLQSIFWFVSIWLGIIGSLGFLNVSVDPVVMVIITTGSWYSIDVVTHLVYSFYRTAGTDKRSRVNEVLVIVSVILFNTTLASFLGLLIVAFTSRSYVFISVFKILMSVSSICFLHCFLFIPIGLSFFGPKDEFYPELEGERSCDGKVNPSCSLENSVKTTIESENVQTITDVEHLRDGITNMAFEFENTKTN